MERDAPREELSGLDDPRAPWAELVEDPAAPRALLAVMFTDIVGSTELAVAMGDTRWRALLEQHDSAIRSQIARFGGREVDTAGDAFFAVFDLPIRAVDCALESIRAVRRLGLRIRVGVHMGECLVAGSNVRGVSVHIGARVGAKATGGELLVSSTVRDVVAGAALQFHDRGVHVLKGIEERWHLYAVEPRTRDAEADLPPLLQAPPARSPESFWRRKRTLVAAGAAVAVLISTLTFALTRGPGGLASVPADTVAVIDARSGDVKSFTAVRRRPVGITAAPDGVWVTNSIDRSVTHVSKSGATDTIPVGQGPVSIAAGGGFIWVANADSSDVSRISPQTGGQVGQRIRAGNGLSAIAFGAGAVWLANSIDGTIWRIDPRTARRTHEIQVGHGLRGLAVTDDAVWVTSESAGTLTRIDPRSGVVVRTVRIGGGPIALAVAGGAAWLANAEEGTATRVDIAAGKVTTTQQVGAGPRSIAIAAGHVFVANETDGTISMLDAASGERIRTIRLRNAPMAIAVSGDRVWVTVRGGVAAYKGGTLRLALPYATDTLDPAYALDATSLITLNSVLYDGLTSFKRVGGPNGNDLVPNLAEEIRPPTDGGRTYSFTLRESLVYSDGTPVKASDVRASFERILRSPESYGRPFVEAIKGSESCTPNVCNLGAGIQTDDAARTVVITLRLPNADFLYHLALPALVILPAKIGPKDAGVSNIPGTGPYTIAEGSVTRKAADGSSEGTVVLKRNPRFVSRGLAQPDGYPDRIEVKLGGPIKEHVATVEDGRQDVLVDTYETDFPALANELPAQVHIFETSSTLFATLNTRVPPFNDIRARQAVNYAVDRRALIEATSDRSFGDPTCQLLPRNTIGYVPYCPYTKGAGDLGVWIAPDLDKARRLVAESRTAGQSVTVWAERGDSFGARQRSARATLLASTLAAIGYKSQVREVPGDYFETVVAPDSRHQVSLSGWVSDYAGASNFFLPLLTCPQTLARLSGSTAFAANIAHVCDPKIDAMIEQALATQITDPAAARDRWAAIDRAYTDLAGLVPWATLRLGVFVSSRVGNVQSHAAYQVLLSQMWVTEPAARTPR